MTDNERDYRDWLINCLNVRENDYTNLLRELYNIEFFALIQYDEDRGTDGLALRDEWADRVNYRGSLDFGVANFLEVLVGIAKRLEFLVFGTKYYDDWDYINIFWELIDNLGLGGMFCDISRYTFDEINEIVTLFMNRDYFRHKNCNIFKFENEPKNLRKMNIWTQMGIYGREKWPI